MKLTKEDKKLISKVVDKIERLKSKQGSNVALIDFDSLYQLLNHDEKSQVDKFLKINPKDYGFNGEYLGISDVPNDLAVIDDQKYVRKGKEEIIPTQFLPQKVYDAYKKLNEVVTNELGKPLLIESAYRSPAYQIATLLYILRLYKFDLAKTLKRATMPGYSEHNYPPKQAIDFMTVDGIPTDEEPLKFADTPEYKWLLEKANKYDFYLSYPADNTQGIMYEPWHWHYEK